MCVHEQQGQVLVLLGSLFVCGSVCPASLSDSGLLGLLSIK